MPSAKLRGNSEKVNYVIRPNKATERKLIVDTLGVLSRILELPSYQYIGMGAMWFVDFILVHKTLQLSRMFSIEYPDYAERAEFNRPFNCIEVVAGDASAVLRSEKIDVKTTKSLVWLDYITPLDDQVIQDIDLLATNLPIGSIIIFTVNAHKNNYKPESPGGGKAAIVEHLRSLFGDLVPDLTENELADSEFLSRIIGSIMFAKIQRMVTSAREAVEMIPIFNYRYSDGSPMVTVGALISDTQLSEGVRRLTNAPWRSIGDETQIEINVPPLTLKEKLVLDRTLPNNAEFTEAQMKSLLGFTLPDIQLQNYRTLYPFYPAFAEVLL